MRSARSVEGSVGQPGQSSNATTARVAAFRLILGKQSAFKKVFFRQTKVRQLGPGMLQQIRASCDKVGEI